MAELSLKQISDKLDAEFSGKARKLIFWYDANAEFASDIDSLQLTHAKLYRLRQDNQFQTKYFLECVDTKTNYLIYAPFPKPPIAENHLADMIHYSREFFADRASLIVLDLNMDDRCKPILQQYSKFIGVEACLKAFYDLEIGRYNRSSIEIGMMAVLCKCKLPSFVEVVRCVLTEGDLDDNPSLAAFEEYGLQEAFWRQCENEFGYIDAAPSLEKLVMTLFVTYGQKVIYADIPAAWRPYVSYKSGNIIAFLDNLMNNILYSDRFDALSERVYRAMDIGTWLAGLRADAYAECALFAGVDRLLIRWMIDRLLNEDAAATLQGESIPQACGKRKKTHFGAKRRDEYDALRAAWYLLHEPAVPLSSDLKGMIKRYTEKDFEADRMYRRFYLHLDSVEDGREFDSLRERVEQTYLNKFLNPLCSSYALAFSAAEGITSLPRQTEFYRNYISPSRERIAVIISDALRYEVGMSLYERLEMDEKCSVHLSAMQSVLPSITRAGMAALLPHRALRLNDAKNVTVDGRPTIDLPQREAVLRARNEESRAVQFDDVKGMPRDQLRDIFAHRDVVYIYHNRIDARGDKANTQDKVFEACEEALDEICAMIRRLTTSANTTRFIVTADHGFIYKRDKLTQSDKIAGVAEANQRYAITDSPIQENGVGSIPLAGIYGDTERRVVNFPIGSDLFKAPGAGQNYVHGGCSPQEMIVPLLQIKTEKSRRETYSAKIDLISLTSRITNLIATLDFIQTEPVSDVVKEAKYCIFFASETGEKISNENNCDADRRDRDATKRVFKLRFSLKNQRYDPRKKYYLVIQDKQNNLEILRREFNIDLAFTDDFGF